jgi:hypothetical protein
MPATKLSVYQEAARLLGDARLATITDDIEIRYAMDDAWPGAVAFVLRQAPWRFALKTAALVAGGTPVVGYTISYSQPADWLRTHTIFRSQAGGLECPFDLREHEGLIACNIAAGAIMRYVSTAYLDPAFAPWPEHFTRVAAAYLAFSVAARITQSAAEETRLAQLFASLLPEAIAFDAVPENPWLRFQLDGRFQRGAQNVAQMAHWRYALKTIPLVATPDAPVPGYAYSSPVPSDWVCTQALYVAIDGR